MKSYQNDDQIVRDRQRQYMRAAANHRLIQMAQVYRPGIAGRVLAGLGGWMIASGMRLRERYAEEMQFNRQDAKNAKLEIIGY